MSVFRKMVHKGFWWHALVLSAFVWGILIIPIVRRYAKNNRLDPMSQLFAEFRLTDLYFHSLDSLNQPEVDSSYNVVIINVEDCNRKDISEAISAVAKEGPKVIGLDIIFGDVSSTDPYADTLLAEACYAVRDCLVIASRMEGDEHSFFAKQGITEGVVDFDGRVLQKFHPIYHGEPSFDYLISEKAGLNIPKTEEGVLINYDKIISIIYNWKTEGASWHSEDLKDKIVLIGDTADLRDFQDIPVRYLGKSRISGILIHQQILSSYEIGKTYKSVSLLVVLIISILVVWLYCATSCCRIYCEYPRFNGFYIQMGYLIGVSIIIAVHFLLFHFAKLEFDLTWLLSAMTLAAFFTEFFYYVYDVFRNHDKSQLAITRHRSTDKKI